MGGRDGSGRVLALLAGAAGCLAVVVAASGAGPLEIGEGGLLSRLPQRQLDVSPTDDDPSAEESTEPSATDGEPVLGVPIELVVAVLATSAALALLARSLWNAPARSRDRTSDAAEPDEPRPDSELDSAGVARAAATEAERLTGLTGAAARDAVIACWVALEAAAETRRRPADSPTVFAQRLLAASPTIDAAELERLRLLYARTRFGRHLPTVDEVADARAALRGMSQALAGTERSP